MDDMDSNNIPSALFIIIGAVITGAIVFAGMIVAAILVGLMVAPAA
jgi:hypothetical protein